MSLSRFGVFFTEQDGEERQAVLQGSTDEERDETIEKLRRLLVAAYEQGFLVEPLTDDYLERLKGFLWVLIPSAATAHIAIESYAWSYGRDAKDV